jgi:uncharacterized RDD family membrane protein YckC
MKCPVCSHVYPDTLSRCSRCGRVTPDAPPANETRSTLIEFPATRQARTSLPDWRVELNEKVRAIKARRSMEALVDEAASLRQAALAPPTPVPAPPPPEPTPEPSNPIVAAALDRVRRASENAARATRQSTSQGAAAQAATAHARVAVPLREHAPRVIPLPPVVATPEPLHVAEPAVAATPARDAALFDPAELLDGIDDDLDLIDFESERREVLALGPAPTAANASLPLRAVASLVDLAVYSVVSIPFVATTYAIDGDFGRPAIVVMLASTLALLGIFYLFSMFALCGRTIGMMLSRTHVVGPDGGPPPPRAIFLRVVGTILSLVPVGLGFAWALFNADRCGWHDLISGTRVVED